ncbi:MAG: VOC family protein [Nocardioides sp.]
MRIASTQLWVHDQEVALDFYTKKLGMEVRSDVTVPEMGNFRWLTVSPAGQDDVDIVLMMVPPDPITDETTRAEIATLMAKGMAGTVFLTTEDCRADYARLKAAGVEFTGEPEDQMYGVDVGMRDPSGNHLRLTQLATDWG